MTTSDASPVYGVADFADGIDTIMRLKVYYYKKPANFISIAIDLEIDEIYDAAIKFYVVSQLMKQDKEQLSESAIVSNYYAREL